MPWQYFVYKSIYQWFSLIFKNLNQNYTNKHNEIITCVSAVIPLVFS